MALKKSQGVALVAAMVAMGAGAGALWLAHQVQRYEFEHTQVPNGCGLKYGDFAIMAGEAGEAGEACENALPHGVLRNDTALRLLKAGMSAVIVPVALKCEWFFAGFGVTVAFLAVCIMLAKCIDREQTKFAGAPSLPGSSA